MVPVIKLAFWENPREQGQEIVRLIALPLLAILVFLAIWSTGAARIDTSLGTFPGPAAVASAVGGLYQEHLAEREKASAF